MPLALFAALAVLPYAASTQVVALDLDGLAAASESAVWGRVVEVTAARRVENPKLIETAVTVAVTSQHVRAGSTARSTVRFVVPGGVVGRFGQRVAGAPTVSVGEELVVLLEPLTGGRFGIAGFNQGLWRIQRTSAGVTAVSDRSGVEFVAPVGAPTVAAPTRVQQGADALWSQLAVAFARTGAPR